VIWVSGWGLEGDWEELPLCRYDGGMMAAAARKATMSAFTITQLMPSCEAVQKQLLALYICRPLVDRHLEISCTSADRMVFILTKVTSLELGCYPCLVRLYSSRRWGRMYLAEIDSSLTAVRRLWLLRSGDAPYGMRSDPAASKSRPCCAGTVPTRIA